MRCIITNKDIIYNERFAQGCIYSPKLDRFVTLSFSYMNDVYHWNEKLRYYLSEHGRRKTEVPRYIREHFNAIGSGQTFVYTD